jgi:hypothetical protein
MSVAIGIMGFAALIGVDFICLIVSGSLLTPQLHTLAAIVSATATISGLVNLHTTRLVELGMRMERARQNVNAKPAIGHCEVVPIHRRRPHRDGIG